MASLAKSLRALDPAPAGPAIPLRRRRSDAFYGFRHARFIGGLAIVGAANAVERRTRVFRRSLISADVLSAAVALALSVQVLGDDYLRATTLIALPMIVLI